MAISTPTTRIMCKHPGCTEPAAAATGPGRPPEYCEGRGHTRVSAWREQRRLAAAQNGTTTPADTHTPVPQAKVTGAELLRMLRAETDRVAGIADRLREAVDTVTDPTAAEAELEAVRAAAEQRAAAAEARAAAAEQRAAEADQWRAEADCTAAEADRDATVKQARNDADTRVAAAEAERDTAIAQARDTANRRVGAAETARDHAVARAGQAEQAARLAQQDTARAPGLLT